ncbi:MAG: oxidoreductase [Chloroflexi bacterium HGW-Chloroflexi-9]|nr:MAG: oxidoreductase [Chloroflexi bacterium HGW-Chloroflexi-9]
MTQPTHTLAAYITEGGPPECIHVGELPVPPLGATDVLVETEALVVDPVDTYVRAGASRARLPFPYVIGRDLVGSVLAAGASVADAFAVGDRVWCNSMGTAGLQGSFARHVVVPAERLYHLPDGVPAVEAVAVLHGGATAYLGLIGRGVLRAGGTIVVGGAGGSVGSCVTQLAVAAGARVLATAREDDFEWCRSIGAAAVFDYRDPDLGTRLREAAPDGVEMYWDTSGHHDLELATAVLARRGTIILMANGQARPVLPVGPFYARDATMLGFVLGGASTVELAAAARLINQQLAASALRVRIGVTLPLADAAESHRLVESGFRPGRVVVTP